MPVMLRMITLTMLEKNNNPVISLYLNSLDGLPSAFLSADANTLFECGHKYLAVANLSVAVFGTLEDGLDRRFYKLLIPGVLTGFAVVIGVDIYGRIRRRG